MADLRDMLRKEVVVTASGTTYTGTLVEVTEDEVLLRTPSGWVSVQMSRVSAIRTQDGSDAGSGGFASNRFIDQSFYDMEPE